MTDQAHTITEDQLHAYVDGQLDETARHAVERYLAQNAQAAARVKSWQTINMGLQRLAGNLNATPGRTLEWKHGAGDELASRRARKGIAARLMQLTAVAASVAVGVFAGWMAHQSKTEREEYAQFVRQAAVAYKVFASPVQARPVEITADERERLQRWLSGKMGLNFAMKVPHLEAKGWNLVGGRMLTDSRGPTALYVYEHADKRRLALYVAAFDEQVKRGGTWSQDNAVEICDWGNGRLHMALAGQVERDQMKQLLAPINEQIIADANAPDALAAIPELPVPQITVSLNTHQ